MVCAHRADRGRVTAPVRQKIRCLVSGHDWREAIDPRAGAYHRCRRCWRVDGGPNEGYAASAGSPAAIAAAARDDVHGASHGMHGAAHGMQPAAPSALPAQYLP